MKVTMIPKRLKTIEISADVILLYLLLIFIWQGCAINQTKSTDTEPFMKPTITYSADSAYGPDDFWPDEQMEVRFEKYWSYRLSKRPEEAKAIEAPHIPEMISQSRYETYVNGTSNSFQNISLKDRNYKSPHIAVLDFSVKLENRKIPLQDYWLLLEGKWYHLLEDPILFPELELKP